MQKHSHCGCFCCLYKFSEISFSASAVTVDLYDDLDNTSVESDLKKMSFKFEEYPKDRSVDYCQVITLIE